MLSIQSNDLYVVINCDMLDVILKWSIKDCESVGFSLLIYHVYKLNISIHLLQIYLENGTATPPPLDTSVLKSPP